MMDGEYKNKIKVVVLLSILTGMKVIVNNFDNRRGSDRSE